ncbi:MAG: tol-pal system-associated acyl-CoA thioesterase [Sulfuriferula sp.]|nr:tol-pal system-associated acyl-CoA thioesterase [Sulfuriferula sp.]
MLDAEFIWQVRVYYEDTDAAGVVYYANYLKFMERARTEWLRALGVEQPALLDEHGVVFVVRHVTVDYLKPARFNDSLAVSTRIKRLSQARIRFAQHIQRDCTLVSSEIEVVCVNAVTFKPVKIPDHILQLLE